MSLILELASAVVKNLPDMSDDVMQNWVERPKDLQNFLKGLTPLVPDAQARLREWESFYHKHFGFVLDLSGVVVPQYQLGFDRLIVVAQELVLPVKLGEETKPRVQPLNLVYNACAKQFPCWRYVDDLDKSVTENDRDPRNSTYAIWVRDRVEADQENKNLSANQLRERKHQGIVLLERELYELKYFDETGKHLDLKNWTRCAGSRDSDGGVPFAGLGDGGFGVSYDHPDHRNDYVRSRSAVILPAPQLA